MKLTIFAACVSLITVTCNAMPMTFRPFYQRDYSNPMCTDSVDGTKYNVGTNITRVRDQAICSCTFENQVLRFQCRLPVRRTVGYGGYNYPGYTSRETYIGANKCSYDHRLYSVGQEWTMAVNGVDMHCTCNVTLHIACSVSSTYHSSSSFADPSDLKCNGIYQQGEQFVSMQSGGYLSLCTCNIENRADCGVPTETGQSCQFPFEEEGNLYSTCRARLGGSPYCVINTDRNGFQRANCLTQLQDISLYYHLIITIGGNSNGAICHFPFTYNNVRHNSCIQSPGRTQRWCSTTENYDLHRRFGYCPPGGSRPSTTSETHIFNQIGQTARLECRYDETGSQLPNVRWYKVSSGTRQLLGQYDAETGLGSILLTVRRIYQGRISIPSSRYLEIRKMTRSDAGIFECDVSYPWSGGRYVSVETSLESVPKQPGPYNIHYEYTPSNNIVNIMWENPETDFDKIKLIYQEGNRRYRANLGRNAQSFATDRLRPGNSYNFEIYTVTDGVDSEPGEYVLSLPSMAISNRPLYGDSGETVPSLAQPLRQRQTSSEIKLDWISNPFTDDSISPTSWMITYEDVITNEVQTIRLPAAINTYAISGLTPGRSYRIKLFAVVDDSKIEIASTAILTEHTPIQIQGVPQIEATPHTVEITWNQPEEPVNYYEISYRIANAPGNIALPVVYHPFATIHNLLPNEVYEITVVPVSDNRRGVPFVTEVRTASSDWGPTAPENLVLSNPTATTFVATWDRIEQPNIQYKVTYQPLDEVDATQPVERITSQHSYTARYLQRGVPYLFKVYAVVDSHQSQPAVAEISTVNEVCRVNGRWYGRNEEFFKRNSAGYMQNCTCSATATGGRWRCDPILCTATDGSTYTVGGTWRQRSSSKLVFEDCTCTLNRGSDCIASDPIPESQGDIAHGTLGSSLYLNCDHELDDLSPTVQWFKVHKDLTRTSLYIYHGYSHSGHQDTDAGNLVGRMRLYNNKDLVIEPLQASDAGTYECEVTVPGSPNSQVTHRTRISLQPRPIVPEDGTVSIPAQPRLRESTDNTLYLKWDSAIHDGLTGYRIEYRDIYDDSDSRVVIVNEPEVTLDNLRPSTTYRVTVIPLVGSQQGNPVSVLVSTSGQSEVTPDSDFPIFPVTTLAPEPAPIVAPRPPTSIRFYNVRRTSLTVVWQLPYYSVPIDNFLVTYKPEDGDEEPIEVETNRGVSQLPVSNLEPGTRYLFTVQSVRDDAKSSPVEGVGITEPIGSILVEASNRIRKIGNSNVSRLVCRYDVNTPGTPVVTWYKMSPVQTKILTFDTAAPEGSEVTVAETAGDLADRLTTSHSTQLTIEDLRSSDDGVYKCQVDYPTGSGTGSTRIDIGVPPAPVITSLSNGSHPTTYLLQWTVEPYPRTNYFHMKIGRRGSNQKKTEFNPRGTVGSFLFKRLRPGRTYEGTLAARNSNGMSEATPFHFTTLSNGAPDPPTGVRMVNSSQEEIVLEVDGPRQNVQYYRIRYVPRYNPENVPVKTVGSSSPDGIIVFTDFLPDTEYEMNVTAVNGNVESSPLRAKMTTPVIRPPAPTGLKITNLQPREVTLQIEGPTDQVEYYLIRYKPQSTEIWRQSETQGPRHIITVRNLMPVTQYSFLINSVGFDGSKSATLSTVITTPSETNPPNPPQRFVDVQPSSDSITLVWDGSLDNVDHYEIEYQSESDAIATTVRTPGKQQSAIIPSLIPETNYRISVTAVGPGGHSSPVTTNVQTTAPPTPPTGVVLDSTSPDQISFTIEGPSDNVINYIIRYRILGEPDFTEIESTSREVVIEDLNPGQLYEVEISSVNGNEISNPISQTFWTDEVVDEPVPTAPSKPTGLSLVSSSPDQLVFFVEYTEDVDYFAVQYTPVGGSATYFYTDDANPEITLDNLRPDTRYQIDVTTIKSGLSSDTIFAYFTTEALPEPSTPDVTTSSTTTTTSRSTRSTTPILVVTSQQDVTTPSNLEVTSLGVNDVSLRWTAPAIPNISDVVWRYFLRFKPTAVDNLPYMQRYLTVDQSSATLSRLKPNTEYEVILESIKNTGGYSDQIRTHFMTLPQLTTAATTTTTREQPPSSEPTPTEDTTTEATTQSTEPVVASTITIVLKQISTRTPIFNPQPDYEHDLDGPQPLTGPKGLFVSKRGNKDATLVWTPADESDDIDGYIVEYKSTLNNNDQPEWNTLPKEKDMPGSSSSVELTDLSPGTEYEVKIYGMRDGDQSEPVIKTFITMLNSPGHVRANRRDNEVIVNWVNPKGPRTGTRIQYKENDGPIREILLSPDKESFVIPSRGPDSQYEIFVTALGRNVESTPYILTVPVADSAPMEGAPVTFHYITDNTAEIRFDTNGVESPEGWVVTVQDKTEGILGEPINLSPASNSYDVTNLIPGHEYMVIVTNADGTELVGQRNFVTKADKPKNLQISHVTPDEATVTWESSDAPINGYVIQYKPAGEEGSFTEVPLSTSDTSYIIPHLRPLTNYEVRVFPTYVDESVKRYQEPGIAATVDFQTLPRNSEPTPGPTVVATTPPRSPSNIRFTNVTDESAKAKWQPSPDSGVSLYRVSLREEEGNKYVMSVNLPTTYATLTGLKPNKEYRFFVQAIRNNQRSVPTTGNFFTGTNQPKRVTISSVTDSSFDVQWVPEEPDNPLLTGYTVSIVEQDSNNEPVTMDVEPDNTDVTIESLQPGTSYQVSVTSLINHMEPEPLTVTGTTTLPAPEELYFDDVTRESFRVSWDEPNSQITEYEVEYGVEGAVDFITRIVQGGTSVTLGELQPGTTYTVRVSSIYQRRRSNPTIDSVTTLPPASTPSPIEMIPPDGVRAFERMTDSMVVSWEPDNEREHVVRVTNPSRDVIYYEIIPSDTSEVEITGLEPTTEYVVHVTSVNPDTRVQSNPAVIQSRTKPPKPENLNAAEVGPDFVVLEWDYVSINGQPVTEYYVSYVPEEGGERRGGVVNDTEVELQELEPDTFYVVTVQTKVGQDLSLESILSVTTEDDSVIYAQPENIEVNPEPEDGSNGYLVTWSPVYDFDGQYMVRYHPTDGSTTNQEILTQPEVTSQRITGLKPGTEYVIEVAPYGDNFEHSFGEIFYTADIPAPYDVSIIDVGEDSATVTWEALNLFEITEYRVVVYPSSSPSDTIELEVDAGSPKSASLTGLQPDTHYQVEVTSNGINQESVPATGEFKTKIEKPTEFDAQILPDSVIINWEGPDNGDNHRYEITISEGDNKNIEYSNSPSYVLNNPKPNTQYKVEIAAINLDENTLSETLEGTFFYVGQPDYIEGDEDQPRGDYSYGGEIGDYEPDGNEPDGDQPDGDQPDGDQPDGNGPDGDQPDGDQPDGDQPDGDQPDGNQPGGDHPDENQPEELQPVHGTTRITPIIPSSSRPSEAPLLAATSPSTTSAPLDYSEENGAVQVRWEQFSGPVHHYKVVYTVKSSGKTDHVVIPDYLTHVLLNDLVPGKDYVVSVSAVLVDNTERLIGQLNIESDDTQIDRSATIRWSDTHITYDSYKITATPLDNPRATVMTWSLPATQTSAELTNLYPGTRYSVTVKGLRNNKYTTLDEFVIKTNVDPPTNLAVLKSQLTSISISWTKPLANFTGYKLTYQIGETGPEIAYDPRPHASATRHVLTSLIQGQLYVIRLYADGDGESVPAVVRAETRVPNPKNLRATTTANMANVTWTRPDADITEYTLRVVGANGINIKDNVKLGPIETSYLIQNLIPGTKYHLYLTAWVNAVPSNPSFRIIRTPATVPKASTFTSVETESNDGFKLSWRGKSKRVEGWIIVVEPQDDSGFQREIKVDRYTKSYELTNLRSNVAYKVSIYPYSGELRGTPSIINIPAQPHYNRGSLTVQEHVAFSWYLNVPSVTSDSVFLTWNRPFNDLQGINYGLRYKVLGQPDSAYVDVIPQPMSNETSAVVTGLSPGQSYTIQLTATRAIDQDTYTLTLNVTTLLPSPTNLVFSFRGSTTTLQWNAIETGVDRYILKYRVVDPEIETGYTVVELPSTATSTTLENLQQGLTYQLQLYGELGEFQTRAVEAKIVIPVPHCYIPEEDKIYKIGETWKATVNNDLMLCTCDQPNRYSCDIGDWCKLNGNIYENGESWAIEIIRNKKQHCVCDRGAVTCYFRSCYDENEWHLPGNSWYSESTNMSCECVCSDDELRNCKTMCTN